MIFVMTGTQLHRIDLFAPKSLATMLQRAHAYHEQFPFCHLIVVNRTQSKTKTQCNKAWICKIYQCIKQRRWLSKQWFVKPGFRVCILMYMICDPIEYVVHSRVCSVRDTCIVFVYVFIYRNDVQRHDHHV